MTTHSILRVEENLNFVNTHGIDGYWVYDFSQQKITFASSLLIKLFGYNYRLSSDIEKALIDINNNTLALQPYVDYFQFNKAHKSGTINFLNAKKEKLHFNIDCKLYTSVNEQRYIIGALSEYVNTEGELSTLQLLQQQAERYKFIIAGTDVGTWEWNIQTGETIFNEKWANIIGY
ncbi:hypothetical protein, partial [Lishizhenia sp.]|uniref:hypothetical protein n=1 Tax=Lishizhenia sp. TaxID=2497594 RepID=UPI00299EC100